MKLNSKILDVIKGKPIAPTKPGALLAQLFRDLTRGLRTRPDSWRKGIHELVENMNVPPDRIGSTRTNVSDSLSKNDLSWKTFMRGITMLKYIHKDIISIKFTVTVERKVKGGVVETTFYETDVLKTDITDSEDDKELS